MELKDLILETINELSHPSFTQDSQAKPIELAETFHTFDSPFTPPIAENSITKMPKPTHKSAESLKEECEFLEGLQERLLVLFEGLKAEHNQNIESALRITTHFLEHQLNVIQERLELLKK